MPKKEWCISSVCGMRRKCKQTCRVGQVVFVFRALLSPSNLLQLPSLLAISWYLFRVAQIWGPQIGSYVPCSYRFVPSLFIARRPQHLLPSSIRDEFRIPGLYEGTLTNWIHFTFARKRSESHHDEIRTRAPISATNSTISWWPLSNRLMRRPAVYEINRTELTSCWFGMLGWGAGSPSNGKFLFTCISYTFPSNQVKTPLAGTANHPDRAT